MHSALAAHFDALRRRFPAESSLILTRTQYSFENMEALSALSRPAGCRSAYFEIAGTKFLVWELDDTHDRFEVFATTYNIPLGVIQLSSKPSGRISVAGFTIDLDVLATFIEQSFKNVAAPPADQAHPQRLMMFGFCENFGHHVWNEVAGLTSVLASGIFENIDGIIVGPFDYFHLEPALRAMGKQVKKFTNMGVLLQDQVLVYHNNVVTQEARNLLLENAASQGETPQLWETGKHAICFQIRQHRRRWVHEEEKLAEIITACAREWPGTVFFIDGHSSAKGVIPVYWQNIAQEAAMVARMAAKLDPAIDLRSTVGMDINTKINILKKVDLFVGPIGSGGVLSSWILRKPTIIYGTQEFYGFAEWQEKIVPEGGPLTSAVAPAHVTEINHDDKSYDVDANAIMNLIREQMHKITP